MISEKRLEKARHALEVIEFFHGAKLIADTAEYYEDGRLRSCNTSAAMTWQRENQTLSERERAIAILSDGQISDEYRKALQDLAPDWQPDAQ